MAAKVLVLGGLSLSADAQIIPPVPNPVSICTVTCKVELNAKQAKNDAKYSATREAEKQRILQKNPQLAKTDPETMKQLQTLLDEALGSDKYYYEEAKTRFDVEFQECLTDCLSPCVAQ